MRLKDLIDLQKRTSNSLFSYKGKTLTNKGKYDIIISQVRRYKQCASYLGYDNTYTI